MAFPDEICVYELGKMFRSGSLWSKSSLKKSVIYNFSNIPTKMPLRIKKQLNNKHKDLKPIVKPEAN